MDTSDVTVEKIAFGVLNKMVTVWSSPRVEVSMDGDSLDESFQNAFGQFVIGHLSRVCFEVPSSIGFNSQDAQSRLVLLFVTVLNN